MAEEIKDVNEEAESLSESSADEIEQESNDSEVVENTDSDVAGNLRIALQKERERRKNAEAQLKREIQAPPQDDVEKRFINVEATTLINNKLLTDPSFKDRSDLVIDEMQRTGKMLEDADNAVLARLFREMTLSQVEEQPRSNSLKQIPKQAIPESEKVSPEIQGELDMFDRMNKSFGK